MRNQYSYLLLVSLLVLFSCKKESPLPVNPPTTQAVFSLPSSGGLCSNSTTLGTYTVGTPLNDQNIVQLQVDVSKAGSYSVATLPTYGMTFSATGTFVNTGLQFITLKGAGVPNYDAAVFVYFAAGTSNCSFTVSVTAAPPPGPLQDNDNMQFGNPSNAAMVTDSVNNYLMRKTWYATSYSRDRGTPNWVSWHLYSPDLGPTPRQDDFRADNALPAAWYQVPFDAFSGSGFDRGHNCPSADRTSSQEANSSTFLMTNMIPQAPFQNQRPWASMEDSLRRLVNAGFEIYIVMGTYGAGGTGNNGFATTIHGGRVTVPASVWKIALVLPNGSNDMSRVTESARLIAVDIPNSNTVNTNWKSYRVSVDAIENRTGYDLLSLLPAALQGTLEARTDQF